MYTSALFDRRRLQAAALGQLPCDLTLINAQLVNVITGEIYPASVDVLDGVIVRVREAGEAAPLPAAKIYDCAGQYLLPGLIDAHTHVESSMLTPMQLARAIVPWGTTAICTDPHEIANVMGLPGIDYMRQSASRAALRQFILAPSCVPSAPGLERSGAVFTPETVAALLDSADVIGVAEMMDYNGVSQGSARMAGIAQAGRARRVTLQGHLPQPSEALLAAYLLGGPNTDHESGSGQEVRRKLRQGMRVDLRASSIVDRLEALAQGFAGMPFLDQISLCTDDVHAKDLLENGHLNALIARLIAAGLPPVTAYRMGTWHAAREHQLPELGAIAPGYLADMQLLQALDGQRPSAVFIGGRLVAREGEYLPGEMPDAPCPAPVFHIDALRREDLLLPATGDRAEVLVLERGAHTGTKAGQWQTLPAANGFVCLPTDSALYYSAVINRYGAGGCAVAISRELGLKEGAIASTVSHDCHNLTLQYKEIDSAWACVQALRECGGGMCVARAGKVERLLPLPVAGLMSELPCAALAPQLAAMEQAMRDLCAAPFSLLDITIGSLPAVPGLVLTDCGLVDSIAGKIIPHIKH